LKENVPAVEEEGMVSKVKEKAQPEKVAKEKAMKAQHGEVL